MKRCHFLCFIVLFLGFTNAIARTTTLDAKLFFERSTWIIEATVKKTSSPILHDEFGALAVVSITLDAKIYGEPFKIGGEEGTLEFLTRPDMGESPEFLVGKRYVIFWKGPPPFIAADYYDARTISPQSCVDTRMITGLPDETSVEALASLANIYKNGKENDSVLIRKALEKNTCQQ